MPDGFESALEGASAPASQGGDDCELTILMPCLDEQRTVGLCVARARRFLDRLGIDGEVLVADNGSMDNSVRVALGAGARVIQVGARGYGAALIGGICAARGRFVVMGDADCSYDFDALDPFVARLRAGDQLVLGNRFKGGIAPGAMPWHHRWIGNPVLSWVGRVFFGSPIGDFHCGLRGFDRAAILGLNLRSSGMEFASEMIVKATLSGLRIAEVPTTLAKDGRDRPPHLRSFRDGWRHLRFLLLHCPRWLFLYPALALLTIGWALQMVIFPGTLVVGPAGLDVHTMLFGAAMAIVGLQVALHWMIGQYSAWRYRLLPSMSRVEAWLIDRRLEEFLLFGLVVFCGGSAWAAAQAGSWVSQGFGALRPDLSMRQAIPAVALMVSGVQVAMSGFLLSVIKLGGKDGG